MQKKKQIFYFLIKFLNFGPNFFKNKIKKLKSLELLLIFNV